MATAHPRGDSHDLLVEGEFAFSETVIHGLDRQAEFLRDFVRRRYRYPAWRLWIRDVPPRCARAVADLRRRIRLRSRLRLGG